MTRTLRVPCPEAQNLRTFLNRHYEKSVVSAWVGISDLAEWYQWTLESREDDSHELLTGSRRIIDIAKLFLHNRNIGYF